MESIRKAVRTMTMTVVVSMVVTMVTPAAAQTGPGIPTFDFASVAQAIATLKQMKATYDQIMTQVNMIKGNRGLGMIFDNPALRSYLPDDWKQVYDLANAGRLSGISGVADKILQQEGMTATSSMSAGTVRYNQTLANNKAMAESAYDAVIGRLQNIQSLMQQSNLTQDPAQRQELANRFAAESAQIQVEQARLNLMSQLQQVEEKLAARQANTDMQKRLNADE